MEREGPPLGAIDRRLLELPADFRAEPVIDGKGDVDAYAVAWDVLRDYGTEPGSLGLTEKRLRPKGREGKKARNRLRLILAACWLAADPETRGHVRDVSGLRAFWESLLPQIDASWPLDELLADADRREEFARRVLEALALRPAGETLARARDRLNTLDSLERESALRDAAAAEERARQIREEMARARAAEAAQRYGE